MNIVLLIFKNRKILADLIRADVKNRYIGHHLGIVWAMIQPLIMVAVYWFVFTKGFGVQKTANAPFLLWLLTGMIPWLLLNEAIISSSYSITSQAFLVKKIVFEVRLLPLVKIGAALVVHLGFWVLLLLVCIAYHRYPQFIWLQMFYYLFCILSISLAFGLLFSALMPFALDISQAISIAFQILFWLTPVTWNPTLLPGDWIWVVQLNPFAYIIQGVRDTFIDQTPFWVHLDRILYFWAFTLTIYALSRHTFMKLRPHFADVL